MNLCIDTSVAVDLMRGRNRRYRERFTAAQTGGDTFHLSTIVLHELLLGVRLSARPEHQMQLVDHFRAGMTEHDWTAADADEAADIRADLMRTGRRIEIPDILIAAQARQRGWTLVTANLRDFSRIQGLSIADWTTG